MGYALNAFLNGVCAALPTLRQTGTKRPFWVAWCAGFKHFLTTAKHFAAQRPL